MSGAPVQVGLVAAGPTRRDFRRFLELAAECDPGVIVREEPFRILIEWGGAPLLACHPRATAVHVRAGSGGGEEIPCRTHEDFARILGELLGSLRGRLAAAVAPAGGPAPPASPPVRI